MPNYEYVCDKCSRTFTVHMSMAEHEKGEVVCPQCHKTTNLQHYSQFFAKTSKKS